MPQKDKIAADAMARAKAAVAGEASKVDGLIDAAEKHLETHPAPASNGAGTPPKRKLPAKAKAKASNGNGHRAPQPFRARRGWLILDGTIKVKGAEVQGFVVKFGGHKDPTLHEALTREEAFEWHVKEIERRAKAANPKPPAAATKGKATKAGAIMAGMKPKPAPALAADAAERADAAADAAQPSAEVKDHDIGSPEPVGASLVEAA